MNTGSQQFGRPSMGAWVTYGLGSESQDLPGFVVFSSGKKGPSGGNSNWGSGFLADRLPGRAVPRQRRPGAVSVEPAGRRQQTCSAIRSTRSGALNRDAARRTGDPEIATRINSFEMAYRMQASAPELMDLSKEPKHILEMYGAEPGKPSFANNCLLARRLVERGVRFVQLFHEAWDQHGNLTQRPQEELQGHRPGLRPRSIKDLKQRGLLDDTLVIWGGEFGRTPMVQGGNDGRDHHPNGFTMWLAGGGIKPGITLGETDDLASTR